MDEAKDLQAKLSELQDNYRLTTGEVARFCGVSQQTVIRWCNLGRISNHTIPGSSHRRLLAKDVKTFMRSNQIPFD